MRNMIRWAEDRLGETKYAGWCLSFIEDALEIPNGIEIFGGDSAKASCELYKDALRSGVPEKGAFVFYDCLCQSDDSPVNWVSAVGCGMFPLADGGREIASFQKGMHITVTAPVVLLSIASLTILIMAGFRNAHTTKGI